MVCQFQQPAAPQCSISYQLPPCCIPRTDEECMKLRAWVDELDEATIRALLKEGAILHSDMFDSVWAERRRVEYFEEKARNRLTEEEETKVLDFSKNLESVDYAVNSRYSGYGPNKAAEFAVSTVAYNIAKVIESVRQESTGQNKTKAVVALCRIGSSVVHGRGRASDQVRSEIGRESWYTREIWKIVKTMDDSVKKQLGRSSDMMWLDVFHTDARCVFPDTAKLALHFRRAAGEIVEEPPDGWCEVCLSDSEESSGIGDDWLD